MGYQLPQELQTTKLNSLSGDARTLADEVIAEKFGIGEVVSETSPKFHVVGDTPSFVESHETVRIYADFTHSRPVNLAFPLSRYDSFAYTDKGAYIYRIVEKIQNAILPYEDDTNVIRNMRISIGNSNIIARGYDEIYQFIYDNFRDGRGVS